jgi:hypothetical protein
MDNNPGASNLISYHWHRTNTKHFIVIVNLSGEKSAARIKIPTLKQISDELIFNDKLNKQTYRIKTEEVKNEGFPVELYGWKSGIYEITQV